MCVSVVGDLWLVLSELAASFIGFNGCGLNLLTPLDKDSKVAANGTNHLIDINDPFQIYLKASFDVKLQNIQKLQRKSLREK